MSSLLLSDLCNHGEWGLLFAPLCGLLIVVASLLEHRLGARTSGVAAYRFSGCNSWALGHRLNNCGAWV